MPTQLWLALDVSDENDAIKYVKMLKDDVDVFKIGLELFTRGGCSIIEEIKKYDCQVFLDLKFHDIPNTVAKAVKNIVRHGVDYFDVHASGGTDMMKAAVESAHEESERLSLPNIPKILAITLLTSIDSGSLRKLSLEYEPEQLVGRWAKLAKQCGLDGVVSSIKEVDIIKKECGENFLTVTPGIRLVESDKEGDQLRIGTPKHAAELNAYAIVVGRPILNSNSPLDTIKIIRNQLEVN